MSLLVSNDPTLINTSLGLARVATYALPVVGDILKIYVTFHDGVDRHCRTGNVFDLSRDNVGGQIFSSKTTVQYRSPEADIESALIGHDRDVTLYEFAKFVSAVAMLTFSSLNVVSVTIAVCSVILAGYAITVETDLISEYLGTISPEKRSGIYLFMNRLVSPVPAEKRS